MVFTNQVPFGDFDLAEKNEGLCPQESRQSIEIFVTNGVRAYRITAVKSVVLVKDELG